MAVSMPVPKAVLVPLGHADREAAERIRGNVHAPGQQAVALLGRERPVVADDVRDRVGHLAPSARPPSNDAGDEIAL